MLESDYEGYKKQCGLSEGDRILTDFEERVVRLCHHDFEGLTQEEAAKRLGVSQKTVWRAFERLRLKAPQLFPILTKLQAQVRDYIIDGGLTHKQIAVILKCTKSNVDSIAAAVKAKGVRLCDRHKTIHYEGYMDEQTEQTF